MPWKREPHISWYTLSAFGTRLMSAKDELRPDLVGDGYDAEPLWTAAEVAAVLRVPTKGVYKLPIKRVRLGPRRIRWRRGDVRAFIDGRLTDH
jgi:hypothetical protein